MSGRGEEHAKGASLAAAVWAHAGPVLFLAIFLFFWVSLDAFADLGDPALLLPSMGGDLVNQITALLLSSLAILYLLQNDARRVLIVISPALVVLLAWTAITAGLSDTPAVAIRKIVLAGLIVTQAAALLLIPKDRRQFAVLLATGVTVSLVVSLLAPIFVPHLAIHQVTDLLEPNLAGDWRGVFAHKNVAGSASALMVMIGLFVREAYDRRIGWAIVAGALLLLLLSGSKTPLGMLPISLLVAAVMMAVRGTLLRALIALATVFAINLMTLGSAVFPAIRALLELIGIDTTFTDRTAIWQLSLSKIAERPLTGFGFQSLWGSDEMRASGAAIETWAVKATSAHSGYLDVALNSGLPGLLLFLAWFVLQPARNLTESERIGADRLLNLLFVRIWVFALIASSLESVYFAGGGPVWITVLTAVLGLRLQARATLVPEWPRRASRPHSMRAQPRSAHAGVPNDV